MAGNNLNIRNLPSFERHEYKYRGRMDSHALNEQNMQVFNDILDLYNKANLLQKDIYEANMAANIESMCYSMRLNEALNNMKHLTEQYANLTSTEDSFRTQTRYAYEAVTDDDDYGAVVDPASNTITAHVVSCKSKTKMYDGTYDETYVPDSMQAYIGPDKFRAGGNIISVEDSDIRNAFDGRNDTCWFRKIVTTTDIDHIDNEITIALPEDIITTRLVNQITLRPFPCGFVDIMAVQYKSGGAWQDIQGFDTHALYAEKEEADIFGNVSTYGAIENAPDLKFNFNEIQCNQIKIKFRQRNFTYDQESNRRVWYIGLRDIDVVHNTYTNDHSEFNLVYDFPETEKNIRIYDSDIRFNNVNPTGDKNFGITKEYFYYDSSGNYHKIASTTPFILEGHKLRIRFTIDGKQVSPNVHSCTVKYKLS